MPDIDPRSTSMRHTGLDKPAPCSTRGVRHTGISRYPVLFPQIPVFTGMTWRE